MLSTVWNTQRGSQSSTEKRRGRKEIEVIRRSGGGIKRRETDPASNQSPKCFHSPEHTKRFTELGREEKREGEIEATWCRKRRVKRERELSGQ